MNHHISGAGMLTQKGRDPLDHVQDFGTSEIVRRRGFELQMSHYGVTITSVTGEGGSDGRGGDGCSEGRSGVFRRDHCGMVVPSP